MPRTGSICTEAGVYEGTDIHQEQIAMTRKETFPLCRSCKRAVDWTLVVRSHDLRARLGPSPGTTGALTHEIMELVKKLQDEGCPSCGAKIEIVDTLRGARCPSANDRFHAPALIVCNSCGHDIRMVGPKRLPHAARRIS